MNKIGKIKMKKTILNKDMTVKLLKMIREKKLNQK